MARHVKSSLGPEPIPRARQLGGWGRPALAWFGASRASFCLSSICATYLLRMVCCLQGLGRTRASHARYWERHPPESPQPVFSLSLHDRLGGASTLTRGPVQFSGMGGRTGAWGQSLRAWLRAPAGLTWRALCTSISWKLNKATDSRLRIWELGIWDIS